MKKLPIITLSILAIALITMGWNQEIFYYHFTFTANGLDDKPAYIAGISLSLLLGYFAMKGYKLRFFTLLLFSILCTVIGQNQSYSEKQKSYSMETVERIELTETKQYYIKQIERVDSEIIHNNNLLPDNISDRAYLKKNGVDPIKADIALLKIEKEKYEVLLLGVSNNLSTGTKTNTAFENFAKDIPFISPTLLKYAFQVFMSLFIALMAPSGIKILSTTYAPTQKVIKKPKKESRVVVEDDNITLFANSRFRGEENPVSLKGRGEVSKELNMSAYSYGKFIAAEKKYNLVRTTGNMTIPNVSKSEYVMYLRNKRAYSGCMVAVR